MWGKHSMTEFMILSLIEVTGTEPLGDRFPPSLGQAAEPHAEWWGDRPWAVLGGAAWLWAAVPPAHQLSFLLPASRQRPSRMSHKTAISQPCRALPHLWPQSENFWAHVDITQSSHPEDLGPMLDPRDLWIWKLLQSPASVQRGKGVAGRTLTQHRDPQSKEGSLAPRQDTGRHHFNKLQNNVPYQASLKATELPCSWWIFLKPWWSGTAKIRPVRNSQCRTHRLQSDR